MTISKDGPSSPAAPLGQLLTLTQVAKNKLPPLRCSTRTRPHIINTTPPQNTLMMTTRITQTSTHTTLKTGTRTPKTSMHTTPRTGMQSTLRGNQHTTPTTTAPPHSVPRPTMTTAQAATGPRSGNHQQQQQTPPHTATPWPVNDPSCLSGRPTTRSRRRHASDDSRHRQKNLSCRGSRMRKKFWRRFHRLGTLCPILR